MKMADLNQFPCLIFIKVGILPTKRKLLLGLLSSAVEY